MSYRYEVQFFGGEYRVFERGRVVFRTADQGKAHLWVKAASDVRKGKGMKPIRYELFKRDPWTVVLRAYSSEAVGGFWNVEVVKTTDAYLPGLRAHAKHLAEAWNVPLEDKLA